LEQYNKSCFWGKQLTLLFASHNYYFIITI
jgi:hypothetical protein